MKKPLIAISVNYQEDDVVARATGFGTPAQTMDYVAIDYSRAIERNGGIPLWIPTMLEHKNVAALLDQCDGVLLSGGHDVDPMRYGEFNKYSGLISPKRDDQDLFIAEYALKKGMNVLGICRGSQILNVACGGTLYQDVEKAGFSRHYDSSYPRNYGWHEVKIEEGSLLAKIFGKTELWINSYHHQAVKDPGKRAVRAARLRRVEKFKVVRGHEIESNRSARSINLELELVFRAVAKLSRFDNAGKRRALFRIRDGQRHDAVCARGNRVAEIVGELETFRRVLTNRDRSRGLIRAARENRYGVFDRHVSTFDVGKRLTFL